jgi:hypothetical protein
MRWHLRAYEHMCLCAIVHSCIRAYVSARWCGNAHVCACAYAQSRIVSISPRFASSACLRARANVCARFCVRMHILARLWVGVCARVPICAWPIAVRVCGCVRTYVHECRMHMRAHAHICAPMGGAYATTSAHVARARWCGYANRGMRVSGSCTHACLLARASACLRVLGCAWVYYCVRARMRVLGR